MEEERRLFYVASTRAERSYILSSLCSPSQNGTQIRLMQSRFIKEIDDSRYELVNVHSSFGPGRGFSQGWNQYGSKNPYGRGSRGRSF